MGENAEVAGEYLRNRRHGVGGADREPAETVL